MDNSETLASLGKQDTRPRQAIQNNKAKLPVLMNGSKLPVLIWTKPF